MVEFKGSRCRVKVLGFRVGSLGRRFRVIPS